MWTTRGFGRKPEIRVQLLRNGAGQVNFVGITFPRCLISQCIHFIHLSPCHWSWEELLIATPGWRTDLSKACVNFIYQSGTLSFDFTVGEATRSYCMKKAGEGLTDLCQTRLSCPAAAALYSGWTVVTWGALKKDQYLGCIPEDSHVIGVGVWSRHGI